MAPVEPDDDAPLGRRRVGVEQVPRKAGGGPPYRDAVHRHRPRTHRSPQPRCPELQSAGELQRQVVERGRVSAARGLDQRYEDAARRLVRVIGDPRLDPG